MSKAVKSQEEFVLAALTSTISDLASDKSLGYKSINLERGSFVGGSISFGSLALDLITGGGMPAGKMTTIYGPNGAGKSTIINHAIANCLNPILLNGQKPIPVVLYDHEAAADPTYMNNLGIPFTIKNKWNPNFFYFQPENGTTTYRHMNRVLRELPDFIPTNNQRPKPSALFLVDSLASMIPDVFVENDESKKNAAAADMHNSGLRQIKALCGQKNVSLLCTNQLRLNPRQMFGNPEYEPGGQAIQFYPDLKIKINPKGKAFNERRKDMRFIQAQTVKNKHFTPFRFLSTDLSTAPAIAFGHGFERGYDSYAYLMLTNQIKVGKAGNYCFDMPSSPWHKQNFKWNPLMKVLCSNEFRTFARSQIEDGSAFALYFNAQNLDMPSANLEESGVSDTDLEDDAGPAKAVDEGAEEEHIPAASKEIDFDGEIKMKKTGLSLDDVKMDDEDEKDPHTEVRA